jgi:hypothetical protein
MTRAHHLLPLCVLTFGLASLGCTGSPTTGKEGKVKSPRPRVAVAEPLQDAGEVDLARPYEFTFDVENTGKEALKLTLLKKSCYCAEVSPAELEIAPGATGQVTLRWTPIPGQPSPYTVSLEYKTNDPDNPTQRLEVRARIKPVVRVFIPPNEADIIDFGDRPLDPDEEVVRRVTVFSTEVPKFTLEAASTHPGLVVTKEPLPAETPVNGYTAKSGYVVEVKTSDKLPMGYVREDLRLTIKVPNQPDRVITLPVYAVLGNGVFKVRPETVVFKKPLLTEEDSFKVRVEFIVPSDKESVEVIKHEPAFLVVDKPVKIRPGVWEVTVRVPKNHPEAAKIQPDQFMEGRLVLKTSGSTSEVPVRIKWNPNEP